MPLKYQNEIDSFDFAFECPNNVSNIEKEVTVFRFCLNPVNHENNFLPNVIYDRVIKGGFPYNSPGQYAAKCDRCGASFYYDENMARKSWKSMPTHRRQKLQYTHLAIGNFKPEDGLVTEPDEYSHFGFYEMAKEDNDYLKKEFKIILPPL